LTALTRLTGRVWPLPVSGRYGAQCATTGVGRFCWKTVQDL